MKKILFIFSLLVIIANGCDKNASFIKHLEKFVSGIEKRYNDLNDRDWMRLDKRFSDKIEVRYRILRKDFSSEDKDKAFNLIRKYKDLKISHEKESFLRDLEFFIEDAETRYKDYNSEDLNELEFEFHEFIEPRLKKLRNNFSSEEADRMNNLLAKYDELKIKNNINEGKTKLGDAFHRITKIIKGILSDTSQAE